MLCCRACAPQAKHSSNKWQFINKHLHCVPLNSCLSACLPLAKPLFPLFQVLWPLVGALQRRLAQLAMANKMHGGAAPSISPLSRRDVCFACLSAAAAGASSLKLGNSVAWLAASMIEEEATCCCWLHQSTDTQIGRPAEALAR